ncbi:hypothetical protein GCM10027020_08270 [Nocardioides salsibiostraticola]
MAEQLNRHGDLASGWGRALIFVYGLFAVAATGRSVLQLATEASNAPFAYSLSVVAAVLYFVATGALIMGGDRGWRLAGAAVTIELLGVLVIGSLSYLDDALFPDKTVWSYFGQGYGYVPLLLPIAGLAWLRHTRTHTLSD